MKKELNKSIWALWIYIGVEFLVIGMVRLLRNTISFSDVQITLLTILISVLSSLSVYFYAKKRMHFSLTKEDFHIEFSWEIILSVFLIIMGLNLFNTIWAMFLNTVFHINIDTSSLVLTSNMLDNALQIIHAIIIAPVMEELVFRGVILRSLNKVDTTLAIIASGILFGLMHMDLTQMLFAAVLGMVLAYISLQYQSMGINILLHAMNNTWATIITIATMSTTPRLIQYGTVYVETVLLLAGAVYCIYLAYRLYKKKNFFHFQKQNWKDLFVSAPAILYILFCVGFAIKVGL